MKCEIERRRRREGKRENGMRKRERMRKKWIGKIAHIKIDDVDNSIGNVIQAPQQHMRVCIFHPQLLIDVYVFAINIPIQVAPLHRLHPRTLLPL